MIRERSSNYQLGGLKEELGINPLNPYEVISVSIKPHIIEFKKTEKGFLVKRKITAKIKISDLEKKIIIEDIEKEVNNFEEVINEEKDSNKTYLTYAGEEGIYKKFFKTYKKEVIRLIKDYEKIEKKKEKEAIKNLNYSLP